MNKLIDYISKEWAVLSGAPFIFIVLSALMFGLAYLASRWRFSSIIEHERSAKAALREQLNLRKLEIEDIHRIRKKNVYDTSAVIESPLEGSEPEFLREEKEQFTPKLIQERSVDLIGGLKKLTVGQKYALLQIKKRNMEDNNES